MEAALTKKLSFIQNPDDGFLALLGRDGNLHATLFNEEDRVSDFALDKDILTVLIIGGSASSNLREQLVGIILVGPKCRLRLLQGAPSLERRQRNTLCHQ